MSNYGRLITPPIELQRRNFTEMCDLLGVIVNYQVPLMNKQYNTQGELDTTYSAPERVAGIFTNFVDQKTAKKLGWNAELDKDEAVIHLPYDLHDLQIGCLVEVPSAYDGAPGRKFRVIEMSAIAIYPASIACKLALEYETTMARADTKLFVNTNFNLLNEGE